MVGRGAPIHGHGTTLAQMLIILLLVICSTPFIEGREGIPPITVAMVMVIPPVEIVHATHHSWVV